MTRITGRRINPLTGETVDGPEADNYAHCDDCGGMYDMRDLGAVLTHAGPLPHPSEGRVQ